MKKKLFVVKVFKLVVLLLCLILFCMVYLAPSIKGINHLKRNIKDKTIAINDFSKIERKFVYPKQRELACFYEMDQQLRGKIPKVRFEQGKASLWSKHADYFLSLAAKWHVRDLIICDDENGEKKPLNLTPGSDKNQRLYRFCQANKKDAMSKARLNLFHLGGGQSSLLDNGSSLRSMHMLIAFRADIRTGSMFVNQISQEKLLAHMVSLKVRGDRGLPFWLILVKLYYFDMTLRQDSTPRNRDKDFHLIDLNADLLLHDISPYVKRMGKRDILTDQFGGRIFSSISFNLEENQPKKSRGGKD